MSRKLQLSPYNPDPACLRSLGQWAFLCARPQTTSVSAHRELTGNTAQWSSPKGMDQPLQRLPALFSPTSPGCWANIKLFSSKATRKLFLRELLRPLVLRGSPRKTSI